MFSKVNSGTISGIDACMVNVETDVGFGLPVFDMSGVLAQEVKEARERIRVAIKNSGFNLKPQRILVNISPADIRKDGTGFDLPIAIGIMAANDMINSSLLDDVMIIGELSLDGHVNTVKGVLPCVCQAEKAGFKRCIVPKENLLECSSVKGISVYGADTLKSTYEFLNGNIEIEDNRKALNDTCNLDNYEEDFSDVKGQFAAKRATMIAAAGMHNIMYVGPPGSGKTMLAKRIPTILPSLTFEESMELTKIYSIAGQLDRNTPFIRVRQFRNPHHSITPTALLGGGRIPSPGEITLASGGVLFMDEMTEYQPAVLEALRQPLEDRNIKIVRLNATYTYPADFMLAGAINPCRCGYFPDRNRCNCSEHDIRRYIGRISPPIWDRFDICIGTQSVKFDDLNKDEHDEFSSDYMRELVEKARVIQQKRFKKLKINFNSQMNSNQVKKFCKLGEKEKNLLNKAFDNSSLTARGYYKLLKVARTIADIEGEDMILDRHICEAASYKSYGGDR